MPEDAPAYLVLGHRESRMLRTAFVVLSGFQMVSFAAASVFEMAM
jgi:hypothetical protein